MHLIGFHYKSLQYSGGGATKVLFFTIRVTVCKKLYIFESLVHTVTTYFSFYKMFLYQLTGDCVPSHFLRHFSNLCIVGRVNLWI